MLQISAHRELLSVLLANTIGSTSYYLVGRELGLPFQGFHANVCDDVHNELKKISTEAFDFEYI